MAEQGDDDREAILARRNHFIARALDGIEALRGDAHERTKRRTRAAVVAMGSLAIACPCLDVAPPDTGEAEGTPTDLPSESTGTAGTEGGTGETGTSGAAEPAAPAPPSEPESPAR